MSAFGFAMPPKPNDPSTSSTSSSSKQVPAKKKFSGPYLPPPVVFLGDVTPVDVAHAEKQNMGAIRNSILHGRGNVTGFIGEAVLMRVLRNCAEPAISDNVSHVDRFAFDVLVNGHPLEIKTKRVNVAKFYKDYDNCVNGKSCRQVGHYVFLRLLYDDKTKQGKVWFVGCWPCHTFAKEARFLKRGQKIGYWPVKADGFAMPLGG